MYPLILVPLDGSPFAEGALPAAMMLAARHQAPLHLMAVHAPFATPLDMPGAPVYDGRLDTERRRELDSYLARTAERLSSESALVVTHATVDDSGSTAGTIIEEAARRGAGLVVLSTHGRGGFSRAWLGSVTSELLRTMPVPTLVVRNAPDVEPRAQAPTLGHVLLPLDGSALALAALEPALALSEPFGATLTVLRVVRTSESQLPYDQTFWTADEERVMEKMRVEAQRDVDGVVTDLRGRGRSADGLVVLDSDPARTILRVADERGADLVAMSTRGHGGLTRMIVGSVTDKVVRGSGLPVLVVRPVG
ncbi:MAG: universal stress protein [Gemmatimonadaceae bacterium]